MKLQLNQYKQITQVGTKIVPLKIIGAFSDFSLLNQNMAMRLLYHVPFLRERLVF